MATDFFDRQDHARRQTTRLLVMFALAVVVIILAIYLLVMVVAGDALSGAPRHGRSVVLWNPVLLAWVSVGTLVVVGLGSLYKISELRAGGEAVALMLGGRPVNPQTTDLAERRLLNVVEEMALASGVPVPPVYVLDHEPAINAFAAGYRPEDAVVAVSAGALEYLTREQLQGVMAHEFSHVLNGDMRLNLRLVGLVYGILILAIIGYYVMRLTSTSSSSRSDSKKNDGTAGLFFLGLGLLILGYLGVFLGNLIKSAISRQREFLADASAVQFTRDPSGIAGALKKIGGFSEGSRIRDAHAAEISHMFFGDAFAGSFFNLFATHPPLIERIRRLEPDFDGQFSEAEPAAATAEEEQSAAVAGLAAGHRGRPVTDGPVEATVVDAGDLATRVGQPQAQHLHGAGQTLAGMPQPLLEAAREPFSARAVIYALLLSRDDAATRQRQLQMLAGQIEPLSCRQTQQLAPLVQSLAAEARLPLVSLTVPALKRFSPQQYAAFHQVVEALVHADGKMDLFEYCVRTVLFGYLDVHFGVKPPPAIRYRNVAAVAQPAAVVLSALAYAGHRRPEDIERAFQAGASRFLGTAVLLPGEQCTFEAFDAALDSLSQASPQVKRGLIEAIAACITADGRVTLEEGELLRAVAAVLSCPLPPLAVG